MIEPDGYDVLTFDCYGTLIDWETGILGALTPVLSNHGIELDGHEILRLYSEAEAEVESGPFVKYREVLSRVVTEIGDNLGFAPSGSEVTCLADSLGTWPTFPDTVTSLRSLKRRFRLGIISNVDNDLFQQSASLLGTEFDWVITAEDAQSYKPSRNNFRMAMDRIGVPSERILHVAESLRHDIVPAGEIGLDTVWVNRKWDREGVATASGNIETSNAQPDAQVPDLSTLVSLLTAAA
jgi:2-haloacid dehalogenase